MKQTIITIMLALVAMAGQGQSLKSLEATFNDYIPLLNAKGYMAYSFDTKDFKGKQLETVVMEYVDGKEVGNYLDFDVSFPVGEKLVIGLAPSDNDSLYVYSFQSDNDEGFTGKLILKPVFVPREPRIQRYLYQSRPIELVSTVDTGIFMPLVLFGSYWYDADSGVFRFCGDKVIKSDLSSDIIRYMPHFYILGIKIR
jgi:hypothetical protein